MTQREHKMTVPSDSGKDGASGSYRLAASALDALTAHVAIVGADGAIVLVNRAWREFASANGGADGATCEGANYLAVCDGATGADADIAAEFAVAIREVLGGRRESFVMEYPCHSPEEQRWFTGRVTSLLGNNPAAAVLSHEDITQRRAAVDALRQSEQRYLAILERQTEFVERFTSDGTLTFVNDTLCRYLGLAREDLIGTSFLPMLSEETRRTTQRHLASLTRENPVGENEVEWVTPAGDRTWISWINCALFDQQGNVVEFQAVGRDITERRRTEQRLRDALSERNALLKEVHHRVKNNLAVISAMLRLQAGPMTDPDAIRAFDDMRSRIRTIALVHEQLYVSGEYRSVDFASYVDGITSTLLQRHPEQAGRVEIRARASDVKLGIDQSIPCGLILNELLRNSLQHAFPDERRGEIIVSLERQPKGVIEVSVKDDGVGNDQIDGQPRASGFGLEMVGLLVKQLGGTMEMSVEDGTEVIVRFPTDD